MAGFAALTCSAVSDIENSTRCQCFHILFLTTVTCCQCFHVFWTRDLRFDEQKKYKQLLSRFLQKNPPCNPRGEGSTGGRPFHISDFSSFLDAHKETLFSQRNHQCARNNEKRKMLEEQGGTRGEEKDFRRC